MLKVADVTAAHSPKKAPQNDLGQQNGEEQHFYALVRENLVLGLGCLVAYWLTFVFVRKLGQLRYDKKQKERIKKSHEDSRGFNLETDSDGDDSALSLYTGAPSLPFYIAIGGVGFAWSSLLLLLPLTIIADEVAPRAFGVYTQWLDRSLIIRLWNLCFAGCHVALYVGLPFAFFYHQESSSGVGKTAGALREAFMLQSLVGLLLACVLYVFLQVFQMGSEPMRDALVVMNTTHIVAAAIVCLTAVQRGFGILLGCANSLAVNPLRRMQLDHELSVLEMQIATLERVKLGRIANETADFNIPNKRPKIEQADFNFSLLNTELSSSESELADLQLAYVQKQREARRLSIILKNFFFFALLLLNGTMWTLYMGKLAVHLVHSYVWRVANWFAARERQLGALSELCLIIYFTAATIIGTLCTQFYQRWIWGSREGAYTRVDMPRNVYELLRITAFLLVLGAGMPVVVRLLGLTQHRLGGYYGAYMVIFDEEDASSGKQWVWLVLGYRLTMMIAAALAFLDALRGKVWRLV